MGEDKRVQSIQLEHKERSPWCDVPAEQWQVWRWQLRNRITSPEDLDDLIPLSEFEKRALRKAIRRFRFGITPYYASLVDREDPECPVRRQAIPAPEESHTTPFEITDPLNEDGDVVAPGMPHRYPDRVLWVVIHEGAMYCRHCTRKRKVGGHVQQLSDDFIDQGIAYLNDHPEVRDVLISGGDPLLHSDTKLDHLLGRLRREARAVEVVRIGSRAPVTLPQRITPGLVDVLMRYAPLYVNTHFNVPEEFTVEAKRALALLADAGIPLGNQSVLLHGVNDCASVMRELMYRLTANRVRPYYIYQCDLAEGLDHFRTTVAKGIEIMESLRGHISGFAVPTYVVDAPEGGGKIPVAPSYVVTQHEHKVVLRNFEGKIVAYEEPRDYAGMCTEGELCRHCRRSHEAEPTSAGIAGLFDDDPDHISLIPAEIGRRTPATQIRPSQNASAPDEAQALVDLGA